MLHTRGCLCFVLPLPPRCGLKEYIYIYMRYILTKKNQGLPASSVGYPLHTHFHTRVAHLLPLPLTHYLYSSTCDIRRFIGSVCQTDAQKKNGGRWMRSARRFIGDERERDPTQIHGSGWYHPSHRALASDRNGEKRASRNTSYTRCRCH